MHVGKPTVLDQRQIASKMTEIGRNSVVMYVSDQFIDGKLQLTEYRDPSTKSWFWVGRRLKRQEERFKIAEKCRNLVVAPGE